MEKTIFQLEEERLQWSLQTFEEATALSSLEKLIDEAKETIEDVKAGKREPVEYADMLMCIFDSAGRQSQPISVQEIFDAFAKKLEINKKRNWIKNSNNTYSHVK
jgi:hypothetical protein